LWCFYTSFNEICEFIFLVYTQNITYNYNYKVFESTKERIQKIWHVSMS